jgi:hypothetical protein
VRLTIVTHKLCWRSSQSPTGYASDRRIPLQMCALSKLFDATRLIAPCSPPDNRAGEVHLSGKNLSVVALTKMPARLFWRRLTLPFWLTRNGSILVREVARAELYMSSFSERSECSV